MKKSNPTVKSAKPLVYQADVPFRNPRQGTKILKRESSISRLTTKSQPETKTVSLSTMPPRLLTQKAITSTDASFRGLNSFPKSLAFMPKERNPMFVCIKDQIINEMIVALLKSEKARVKKNIDSNKLTLIEHKNCSMLFSKNGSDPLNNRANGMSGSKMTFEAKFFRNTSSDTDEEFSHSHKHEQSHVQTFTNRNFLLRIHGMNYYLAEIYNETTGDLNDNPKTVDINVESRKAITNDLRGNPMKDNDARSYKLEVIKQNSNQPQVMRLLVCSESILRNRSGYSLPRLAQESVKKELTWKPMSEPSYKFLDLDELI